MEGAPAEDEDEGERHGDDGGVGPGAAVAVVTSAVVVPMRMPRSGRTMVHQRVVDDAGGEGEGNNGPGFEEQPQPGR